MEMGRLTAKLRDAVTVCLLVDGKEIKRYRNIEIPDELKKLECQDFKFDVPLNGSITFKIMFEPGVLPEEFPQTRERKTRVAKDMPVAVERETTTITPVEEATEAIQESNAHIILPGEPVEEVPAAQAVSEEAMSPVKALTGEEAKPEDTAVSETQEAAPATKATAKPKKALTKDSKN